MQLKSGAQKLIRAAPVAAVGRHPPSQQAQTASANLGCECNPPRPHYMLPVLCQSFSPERFAHTNKLGVLSSVARARSLKAHMMGQGGRARNYRPCRTLLKLARVHVWECAGAPTQLFTRHNGVNFSPAVGPHAVCTSAHYRSQQQVAEISSDKFYQLIETLRLNSNFRSYFVCLAAAFYWQMNQKKQIYTLLQKDLQQLFQRELNHGRGLFVAWYLDILNYSIMTLN